MSTISVSRLGKAYKEYSSRWMRLKEWFSPLRREYHQLKWVLEDINFTVNPGEAVGIIGINGAGKSTLLKMITGIVQPTTGQVHMRGRVAALLELGMGFHPDFTGRQNAMMAGQLLGFNEEDMARLMPEIEDFAEIGEYIDRPMRVYSSGMQVRLAFSVATAIRPDILIVDEALSVGDQYFQHKSFERIREFRKEGTTLLLVSHDKFAIQSICDRAILLKGGRLAMEGEPEAVMDFYNALLAEHQNQDIRQEVREDGKVQTTSGSGEVSLIEIALVDRAGEPIEYVAVGQTVAIEVTAVCNEALASLVIGYMIKDRLGQPMYGTNTHHLGKTLEGLSAGARIRYRFEFQANLGPGTYSVAVAAHADDTHVSMNYEWRDHALLFNVVNLDKSDFVGTAWLPPLLRVSE